MITSICRSPGTAVRSRAIFGLAANPRLDVRRRREIICCTATRKAGAVPNLRSHILKGFRGKFRAVRGQAVRASADGDILSHCHCDNKRMRVVPTLLFLVHGLSAQTIGSYFPLEV